MDMVDGYFITPEYDPGVSDPLGKYVSDLKQGILYRQQVATHLMDTEPWDLFVAVFVATDRAAHSFWHCMAASDDDPDARFRHAIRDVYQSADEAIGALLERVDEDTVVIVLSDHGFGPLHRVVNLNRWLAEAGYLHFRPSQSKPAGRWRARLINQLTSAYRRMPPGLRIGFRSKLGAQRFQRIKGDVESTLFSSAIEWSKTKAYALGAGGKIYLNLVGREPEGVVQPGIEYEALRDELVDTLSALQDPETGQRIVRRVWRREELYHGSLLDQAPDLAIEWADYGYWGRGRYDIWAAPVFEDRRTMDYSELSLTGTHQPDGILIISGPGVRDGAEIDGARIVDLMPTVLGILGLPAPAYMDGDVLQTAFVDGAIESTTASFTDLDTTSTEDEFVYTDEDAAQISRRLKDLGYL
jgi:predicted AlkP superfamily phosphohydrolase/phosphomutase